MSKLFHHTAVGGFAVVCFIVVCTFASGEVPPVATVRPYPLPPAWVSDQTVYEVNLRQFSDTGNVEGLRLQLPRLKQLGVGIVWIMPINPIGEQNRSGKLGSPYAVRDFKSFNPEFGTVQELKTMVDEAHRIGLYVILDWVANHTATDHPWLQQHPDWYRHDEQGQLVHPQPTWTDVDALDFNSAAMRKEMIDSMAYWVKEAGIDGFRCDSAEFVPVDFWEQARDALRAIKPVFLLAEGVAPKLTQYAFDASYAWNLPPNMEHMNDGTKTVPDLVSYINADARDLVGGGFRLNFTSNHDKNAWEGTTRELLGDGVPAFTVLTFTLPGMPLIYNGQEAGTERRLNFFDRDPIQWRGDPMSDLYHALATLKRNHLALWCGKKNAAAQIIERSTTATVLTFQRQVQGDSVIVTINLSGQPQSILAPDGIGSMQLSLGDATSLDKDGNLQLKPWAYQIWTSER